MDFRAIKIVASTVETLLDELQWRECGAPDLHTPIVVDEQDYHRLDLLTDIMGTLTRLLDTHIQFLDTDGKIIKEWIENILEIAKRYDRALEALQTAEPREEGE